MRDRIELRTRDLIELWRIAARAKGETGEALRERLQIICQSWLDDLEMERMERGAAIYES